MSAKEIKFIYFDGCPHAENAKALFETLGVVPILIEQTKLNKSDRFRNYTSPSILINGQLAFGALTNGASSGCSVEVLTLKKLKAICGI